MHGIVRQCGLALLVGVAAYGSYRALAPGQDHPSAMPASAVAGPFAGCTEARLDRTTGQTRTTHCLATAPGTRTLTAGLR